jgi:hypothetical protein
MAKRQFDGERAFSCGCGTQNGQDRRAQTLHPDKRQHADKTEQDQQAQLLRSRRHYCPGGISL